MRARSISSMILTATAMIGLAGCGASDSSKFIGTWAYSAGTITLTCGTMVIPMALTSATTETFSAGTSSDLTKVDSNGCAGLKFNVSGHAATAPAGQSCTVTLMGASATITESSYALALSSDEQTIVTAITGTVTVSGQPPCAAAGGGTLTRK